MINSSLLGLIEGAKANSSITNIYGALYGLEGIFKGLIIDLNKESNGNLQNLRFTPGAALGSVRFKMPTHHEDPMLYKELEAIFMKLDIRFFFYIGGNDSMDTCRKIADYFEVSSYKCNVLGIPKTIDNDLVETYCSPGYGSSIKYIANAFLGIIIDTKSYMKGRVTVVEIMGRDAGWLTAGSKLAQVAGFGPDLIYVPEHPFSLEDFLTDVKKIYSQKQHVIVAVAEGIKDQSGNYLLTQHHFKVNDDFGHLQLGGVSYYLAEQVKKTFDYSVRAIELNLPQRSSVSVLSKTDVEIAYMVGKNAISYATQGSTSMMVGVSYSTGFETVLVPLVKVANYVKTLPANFINTCGNDITNDFVEYALPLIQGEMAIPTKNGLPTFAILEKHLLNNE